MAWIALEQQGCVMCGQIMVTGVQGHTRQVGLVDVGGRLQGNSFGQQRQGLRIASALVVQQTHQVQNLGLPGRLGPELSVLRFGLIQLAFAMQRQRCRHGYFCRFAHVDDYDGFALECPPRSSRQRA